MYRTVKDHSGLPLRMLPPVPKSHRILYHWSPTSNRRNIQKLGLVINRRTLQGEWRPPYVCFSDDPYLAWVLSGRMYPDIKSWDLWMCNLEHQTSFDHYELILDTYINTTRRYIKEYRIYTRVFKRDLHYLATRET